MSTALLIILFNPWRFIGMLNELSDHNSPTSDMLAPPEQFAAVMSRVGIGDDKLVVA